MNEQTLRAVPHVARVVVKADKIGQTPILRRFFVDLRVGDEVVRLHEGDRIDLEVTDDA